MSGKRKSAYGKESSGLDDDFDIGGYSDDDGDDMSRRTKKSRRSGASRSIPFSSVRRGARKQGGEEDGLLEEPECVLCRIGLFCDISAQAKAPAIVRIETKIREINHKFVNVNNTNILMADIRDLLNDELKKASISVYGKDFTDLSLDQVKGHFFDCIIEPVLQSRKSFDFWNALFEKGQDTVVRRDEDGDETLDERQINALARIDALRHSSMYPRDPRQSIFFIPGLTVVPRSFQQRAAPPPKER